MDHTSPHDGARDSHSAASLVGMVPDRTNQVRTEQTAFTGSGASANAPNLLDIVKDNRSSVLSGAESSVPSSDLAGSLERTNGRLEPKTTPASDTRSIGTSPVRALLTPTLDVNAATFLAMQGSKLVSPADRAVNIQARQQGVRPSDGGGAIANVADTAKQTAERSSFFNGRLSEQGLRLVASGTTESLINTRPQPLLPNWKPRELNLRQSGSGIAAETERTLEAQARAAAREVDVAHWRKDLADNFRLQDNLKFAEMQKMMTDFEARARKRGLPESEIAATYREVGKLLTSAHAAALCKTTKLAYEIIRNAADPTKIDQGQHPTCNVNSYECKLYASEPSQAARLVVSVATTGRFTCADGTVITPRSTKPDDEASKNPVPDGERNYASQLFQNTAINIHWNRRETLPDLTRAGKGNIQYCQSVDRKGEAEYLLDCSKNPPQVVSFFLQKEGGSKSSPRIGQDEISDINAQITGRPTRDQGIEMGWSTRETRGILYVDKVDSFKSTLERLKAENKLPVLLTVDASMKPFSDGARSDTSFSPHLVTVTDYDAAKGLVAVDNQWGSSNDHTGKPGQKPLVPVDELFAAMRRGAPKSDSENTLGKEVKERILNTSLTDVGKVAVGSLSSSLMLHTTLGDLNWHVRSKLYHIAASESRFANPAYSAYERLSTQGGRRAMAWTSGIGTLAIAGIANDVPGAFMRSTDEGFGKLLRAGEMALVYEGTSLGTHGLCNLARFRWAPGRFGLAMTAGIGAAVIADRAAGEFMEFGGRGVSKIVRDLIAGRDPSVIR
ncbi:MAG: hypothetical protein K2W95_16145 [Candidatus Obscuribacterales bacterium]|nr:hypothetical protein [Candidatus Obscuribacterales bacterium]